MEEKAPRTAPFEQWCVYCVTSDKYGLALQGYGQVSETRIGGTEFLKIVDMDGGVAYYAPGQIAAMWPGTEEEIRRLALGNPVTLNRLPVSSTR